MKVSKGLKSRFVPSFLQHYKTGRHNQICFMHLYLKKRGLATTSVKLG